MGVMYNKCVYNKCVKFMEWNLVVVQIFAIKFNCQASISLMSLKLDYSALRNCMVVYSVPECSKFQC